MDISLFNGAFLVDKPAGMTSAAIIYKIRKVLRDVTGLSRKEIPKIGHAGTLDPFATGLLVVLIGQGVRLSEYMTGSDKKYRAVMKFGEQTDTADLTGKVIASSLSSPSHRGILEEEGRKFLEEPYFQIPPMYSAKKISGRALYKLARNGKEVERPAVECQIKSFDLLGFADGKAEFEVTCSAGTYIRTFAEDLAKKVGSLAYLTELRRIGSGKFDLNSAVPLESLLTKLRNEKVPKFIKVGQCLENVYSCECLEEEVFGILNGDLSILEQIVKRELRSEVIEFKIVRGNEVYAIARNYRKESKWKYHKVFS